MFRQQIYSLLHDVICVFQGAVIFGHRPKMISERVSKWTYGVSCTRTYEEGVHPANRKYINTDGVTKVDGLFSLHVNEGQQLKIDDVQSEKTYQMATADLDGVTVFFHASKKKSPMFVDEPGCYRVGRLDVSVPGKGREREVVVTMSFGKTEVEGSATVKATGEITRTTLDFLDM